MSIMSEVLSTTLNFDVKVLCPDLLIVMLCVLQLQPMIDVLKSEVVMDYVSGFPEPKIVWL